MRPIRIAAKLVALAALVGGVPGWSQHPVAEEVRRFSAPEATQAVAVDDQWCYAIGNQTIAKYPKDGGSPVACWQASPELPLIHLNAGVVIDGRLYCAHSNYPNYPSTSSVEVWDAQSLCHVATHSFGITEGSLTWINRHDGAWWAVFAHYTKKVNEAPYPRDSRWSALVKLDDAWRPVASWAFPQEVIDRFEPHSCSCGAWGRDGYLYCMGHDRPELYKLTVPAAGSTLVLVETIAVPFKGQGFAWDPAEDGIVFGIDRAARQIIAARLSGESARPASPVTPTSLAR